MPGSPKMIYAIVAAVMLLAIIGIRYAMRGAIFDRLPIAADEQVLAEEPGLRVESRLPHASRGWETRFGMHVVLTNRRILLATGGPEGKHKFVLVYVVEYTPKRTLTAEELAAAKGAGYGLENGYATFRVGADHVTVQEEDGKTMVKVEVPYSNDATFANSPVLKFYTGQADKYRAVFGR